MLLPLCVFHGTLLLMSAIETQGFGDLFALLHVAAFGLGLAGWASLEWVRQRAGTAARWAPGRGEPRTWTRDSAARSARPLW